MTERRMIIGGLIVCALAILVFLAAQSGWLSAILCVPPPGQACA